MKPLPHLYEVTLCGGPTDYAALSADGLPELRSAPPKDFDGDAWSPSIYRLPRGAHVRERREGLLRDRFAFDPGTTRIRNRGRAI